MPRLNKSSREHLHFLLLEIEEQLQQTEKYFVSRSPEQAQRILARVGYVDNLRSRARNSLLSQLQRSKKSPLRYRLQASDKLVSQLYQLSRLGYQAVSDSCMLPQSVVEAFPNKECSKLIKRIRHSLSNVETALAHADSQLAISIDFERKKLNKKLTKVVNKAVLSLNHKQHLRYTAELMFPVYAIRQMVDSLGLISEAILSANLGQKMNIARYQSLEQIAEDINADPDDLSIDTVAETRSGSAISGVSEKSSEQSGYMAIFKEGDRKKVQEEKEGVQSWHQIYPGLAPRILSFNKQGSSASMLIEHLPGFTFERILLESSPERADEALANLLKTLKNIWKETQTPQVVEGKYMKQLQQRLPGVFQVHPEFDTQTMSLCGEMQPSFTALVDSLAEMENKWPAPFTVYIHGDFNLDNIIYDPLERRVNFIDLHRSRYMDYVQDISVFMVSIYRLQVMERQQRTRLLRVAKSFLKNIRRYARAQEDTNFEVRLALGLVRSFASSTRFILDPTLSRRMYLRARYLMQQLSNIKSGSEAQYRIPLEDLFIE